MNLKRHGDSEFDPSRQVSKQEVDDAVALVATYCLQNSVNAGSITSRLMVGNMIVTTTLTINADIQEIAGGNN